MKLIFRMVYFLPSLYFICAAKYPNEIVDLPIVDCDAGKITIKIKTTSANPSHIYAEQFHEDPKCVARNKNKITINHGECGMTSEKMDSPAGMMYRICVAVQVHPLFVTENDRSYCAQCVYLESNVVDALEQNIAISDLPPNELDPQFDESSRPKCTYSIRKGSIDGPPVHFATIGDTVVHVWECENENLGILVQNCHVEDLEGNKILIIDQNGCAIDQYLLATPNYTTDLRKAFQETKVFKFADKTMTKFTCQIRLCMKNRDKGCQNLTPPKNCPTTEERESGMVTHENAAVERGQSEEENEYANPTAGVGRSPNGHRVILPPGVPVPEKGQAPYKRRYQYNRNRRELTIIANATRSHSFGRIVKSTSNQPVQELDVEEVIRVLDSPEDVQYYETRMRSGSFEEDGKADVKGAPLLDPHLFEPRRHAVSGKCMSTVVYWSLLGMFSFLITIQAIAIGIFMIDKWLLDRAISNKFRKLRKYGPIAVGIRRKAGEEKNEHAEIESTSSEVDVFPPYRFRRRLATPLPIHTLI